MFHELACLFSDWIRVLQKNNRARFGLIGTRVCCQPHTLPLTLKERWWRLLFPKTTCTYKNNQNSPDGKFHRYLFPFASKFSDLNFASHALYNLPVLCHASHAVSLGYLWLTLFTLPYLTPVCCTQDMWLLCYLYLILARINHHINFFCFPFLDFYS